MILPDEEPSDCEDRRNENYADPNTASVGDFVLVQFLGKKSITYYIGQLLEFTENVEMKTKFLRRSSRKDMNCPSFSFPDNEDIFDHEKEDVTRLPQPFHRGGTKRCSEKYVFPVDLSAYNPR